MATTDMISGANVQITGTLDMRENPISGLISDVNIYPLAAGDGASKAYVDYQKAQIQASLPALANNGTY